MLKLFACASAIALAAPVAAQIETTTPAEPEAAIEAQTPGEEPMADDMTAPEAESDAIAEAQPLDQPETEEPAVAQTQPIDDPAMEGEDAVADAAPATEAQPQADPAQVASFVEQEFPNRDADGDGELSQEEFAAWMVPLFTAQLDETPEQPEIDAWAGAAFAQADTDSSTGVTPDEMTQFLNG